MSRIDPENQIYDDLAMAALTAWQSSCALSATLTEGDKSVAARHPLDRASEVLKSYQHGNYSLGALATVCRPASKWLRQESKIIQNIMDGLSGAQLPSDRVEIAVGLNMINDFHSNWFQSTSASQSPFGDIGDRGRQHLERSTGQALKLFDHKDDWSEIDQAWFRHLGRSLPATLTLLAAALESTSSGHNDIDQVQWAAIKEFCPAPENWKRAGFDSAWACAWWIERSFEPEVANQWHQASIHADHADFLFELGLKKPEDAIELRDRAGSADLVILWIRSGFKPDEALAWLQSGVTQPSQALVLKKSGRNPATAHAPETAPEAAIQPTPPTNPKPTPQIAAPVEDQIIKPKIDLKPWHQHGISDDREIKEWIEAKITDPAQAGHWRMENLLPAQAATWISLGVSRPETATWCEDATRKITGSRELEGSPQQWITPRFNRASAIFGWGLCLDQKDLETAGLSSMEPGGWLKKIEEKSTIAVEELGVMLLPQPGTGNWQSALLCVVDSLSVVPRGSSHHLAKTVAPARWQDSIAQAAAALGLNLDNLGVGWLLGMIGPQQENLEAILFWGYAFEDEDKVPWADSMDYRGVDSWQQRYHRRAEEMGETDLHFYCELKGYLVGSGEGWLACNRGSCFHAAGFQSLNLPAVQPDWLDNYQNFSRILDLSLKQPAWTLVVAFTETN